MSEHELLKHNSEKHLDKSPYVCEHCNIIDIINYLADTRIKKSTSDFVQLHIIMVI